MRRRAGVGDRLDRDAEKTFVFRGERDRPCGVGVAHGQPGQFAQSGETPQHHPGLGARTDDAHRSGVIGGEFVRRHSRGKPGAPGRDRRRVEHGQQLSVRQVVQTDESAQRGSRVGELGIDLHRVGRNPVDHSGQKCCRRARPGKIRPYPQRPDVRTGCEEARAQSGHHGVGVEQLGDPGTIQ